jgi:hypothetical protein
METTMTAFEHIQRLLTPQSRMTTTEVAAAISRSIGHTRRVLRWMEERRMVRLVPGGNLHIWSSL